MEVLFYQKFYFGHRKFEISIRHMQSSQAIRYIVPEF